MQNRNKVLTVDAKKILKRFIALLHWYQENDLRLNSSFLRLHLVVCTILIIFFFIVVLLCDKSTSLTLVDVAV